MANPSSSRSLAVLGGLLVTQLVLLASTLWADAGIGRAAALAFGAVFGGLVYARGAATAGELPAAFLWRGGAVLVLVALLTPPSLSSDLYDGLARGRMATAHGANPYVLPPAQWPEDPYVRAATDRGLAYPQSPLLTAAHSAVCAIAGDRVGLATSLWKILLGLAHLMTGLLIQRAAARASGTAMAGRRALYLYLWNPWILFEVVGQGQVAGGLAAAGVAATVCAAASRRPATATLALGLAALAEPRTLVLAPVFLALAARRHRLRPALLGLVPGVAIATLLVGVYLLAPAAATQLALAALDRPPDASLQALVAHFAPATSARLVLAVGGAVTVVFVLSRLRAVRDEASTGRVAAAAALCYLIFAEPAFAPWQHLGWLPLVALWPGAGRSLIALAALGFVCHVIPDPAWSWATGLAAVAAVTWSTARA